MMMLSMFEAVLYIVDAASYIIELCLSALVAPHALLQRLLKVCLYSWHSAGSMGWLFQMLKYKYIFQITNFLKQHSETVMV